MANVKGPLLSLKAAGTFGKTITYQGRPSGTSAYLRTTSYDSKADGQVISRDYFLAGTAYWGTIGLPYQTQWNEFVIRYYKAS